MSTIQNKDLLAAISSLSSIGKTALPIPLALRMAKLRQNLEAHHKVVEDTRVALVNRIKGDAEKLDSEHPRWSEFQDAFNELMTEHYALPEPFCLYRRENGKGEEFAWGKNFKTKLKELEPNVMFGLLPLVEIVDTEEEDE